MIVLMDPMEDPDDVLRANRSREKSYLFDVAFDFAATQVRPALRHSEQKIIFFNPVFLKYIDEKQCQVTKNLWQQIGREEFS